MPSTSRITSTVFLILLLFSPATAQDAESPRKSKTTSPHVTVTATARWVRFVAPSNVVRMQVEVFPDAGESVFDITSKGNVFNWTLQDRAGQLVADGTYLCVVTIKSLDGKITQRLGTVSLRDGHASLQAGRALKLSPTQQEALGAVEENAALTVIDENAETPPATVLAHDGREGQVTSTSGALSFRIGNFFAGLERERMRLTEDGRLGIGTGDPQATLDVAGTIRATKGIEFADGTVQTTGLSGKVDEDGNITPSATGAGTQGRVAKWTDGTGTLGDASFSDINGLTVFGINSSGQNAPFFPAAANSHVVEIGAPGTKTPLVLAGGSSSMEFWKDLGGSTGGGPQAAVAFGMATPGTSATNDIVFSTYAVGQPWNERMRITNAGNVGIGTTIPTSKMVVAPGGSGGELHFGTPAGETGMGIIGTNRADVRFDGSTLKLVAGFGSGAAPSTNGLAINTAGRVGIGTINPTLGRLHVVTTDSTLPAIYGESPNRGVWGKSTSGSRGVFGESLSGEGVHGESVSGTGVAGFTQSSSISFPGVYGSSTASGGFGVRGDGTTGVFGNSASSNGIGVTGEANAANGRGVYGTSTSGTGFGVFANNPSGIALRVAGHAAQNRDKGGLVKAMAYIDANGIIVSCYNSQVPGGSSVSGGTTTSGCGFVVDDGPAQGTTGAYRINFGFQVNDRFVSVTPEAAASVNIVASFAFVSSTQVVVGTAITDVQFANSSANNAFMIIIY